MTSDTWLQLGQTRVLDLRAKRTDLPEPAPFALQRVLAVSDFVHDELRRSPQLLEHLLSGDVLQSTYQLSHYLTALRTMLDGVSGEAERDACMRVFRRHEMVRIAWRDIAGLAPFEEIAAETSALAEVLIDEALDLATSLTQARYGSPQAAPGHTHAQQLVVFALGKLGAGELNFSSDIDLIFAYPHAGNTSGARSVSHEEYFTRVARRFIKSLDEVSADGFVYRVDMRLRPFGASGPLVASFGAMEDYYQTHGRDWERYAWIRARTVGGDRDAGTQMLDSLRPFIYRRYLDFGALQSLREMKTLINAEVSRGGLEHNIKLGAGGIREIEFLTQAFQLLRGGRHAQLRVRLVPEVLRRLAAMELLPEFAATGLAKAYAYLRTLENRLQQVADQQLHTLPTTVDAQARLATAMQARDWAELSATITAQRQFVRSHFEQVLGLDEPQDAAARSPLHALLSQTLTPQEGLALLLEAGFSSDAERAFTLVTQLLDDVHIRNLTERPRRWLERLLPQLLEASVRTTAPIQTLQRLNQVLLTIAPRATYLALLVERPLAMSQLVRLCAASLLIAEHISRYPLVIDELLDTRTLYAPLRKAQLQTEVTAHLKAIDVGDLEQEMETLRREKQTNVLRVAAADVVGVLPLMQVSDHLSEIAEVCVEHALKITWRDLALKYGVPQYREPNGERLRDTSASASQTNAAHTDTPATRKTAGVAVIAYGKLGGIELGYGSDLDLVYLHGGRGSEHTTSGPQKVDNQLFYARLAQRLGNLFTARTPTGVLYELDVRLRPNGNSGLPVVSLAAFRSYQLEEAWTWEHQALVRARFICGDAAVGEQFAQIRREVLLRERDPEHLRTEVREMRERMLAHQASSKPGVDQFSLKTDRGGIADIEFMTQFLVLRDAAKLGSHLDYTDNIRLLDAMASLGVLDPSSAQTLVDTFRTYRSRVHALALQQLDAVVTDTEFIAERSFVTNLWQNLMEVS